MDGDTINNISTDVELLRRVFAWDILAYIIHLSSSFY